MGNREERSPAVKSFHLKNDPEFGVRICSIFNIEPAQVTRVIFEVLPTETRLYFQLAQTIEQGQAVTDLLKESKEAQDAQAPKEEDHG